MTQEQLVLTWVGPELIEFDRFDGTRQKEVPFEAGQIGANRCRMLTKYVICSTVLVRVSYVHPLHVRWHEMR